MGQVKQNCHYVPTQGEQYRLTGVHPDWEMHPDWVGAIESLDAYNHWVCEVVLPIAFQWIEEHKADVYKNIPKTLKDDVGVVIAEAYELVKRMPAYAAGLKEHKEYKRSLKLKSIDTSKLNPLWQQMAVAIRTSRAKAKRKYATKLKSSLR